MGYFSHLDNALRADGIVIPALRAGRPRAPRGERMRLCFRCGDDQNLVRDDKATTGAVCVWCLQHPDGLNEADEEWGMDSAQQQLERGPR